MSTPESAKQPLTATAASSVEEVTQEKNKPLDADQLALCVARLDVLVRTTCSKIPAADTAEGQLRALREIRELLAKQENKTQFVWTVFLQIFALIFALLFSVFTVLAYNIGRVANVESSDANQLAFISLCLSSNSSFTNTICEEVFANSHQSLPSIATSIFGSGLAGNSTISPSASSFIQFRRIGLVAWIAVALPIVFFIYVIYWTKVQGTV